MQEITTKQDLINDLNQITCLVARIKKKIDQYYESDILLDLCLECVSEVYQISVDQIVSANRQFELRQPRNSFIYIMRSEGFSYTKIAEKLNRNHSTIIHAANRFNELLEIEPQLIDELNESISIFESKKAMIHER